MKMKSMLTCCLLLLGVVAADNTWESYKANHGKKYSSQEEQVRKAIYQQSHAAIEAHNKKHAAGLESYAMAHTHFSDLTAAEKSTYLGFRPQPKGRIGARATFDLSVEDRALPTSYDLRTSKCMPAVKNQGSCGDCWAFATVTPIEFQYCQNKNKNVSVILSEQQVTDCSYASTYNGCNGGDHHAAWSSIYTKGGLEPTSAYAFVSGTTGKSTKCAFVATKALAKLANAGTDIPQDETAIQTALVAKGPITFAYYVSNNFFSYKTGVFSDATCKTDYNSLNHEMVIVGYGVSGTTPYWIVRNQWGTGWGQAGYAFILRGKNTCGIAVEAGYPTVV